MKSKEMNAAVTSENNPSTATTLLLKHPSKQISSQIEIICSGSMKPEHPASLRQANIQGRQNCGPFVSQA
jgi:hypothetical protein